MRGSDEGASRFIRNFVEGDWTCGGVRLRNEIVLNQYAAILRSSDRIAYSNWPTTSTSFELAALLHLIDVHFCGNGATEWNQAGPLCDALRRLGFEYRVEISPLHGNVAGCTSWSSNRIVVELNENLRTFLHNASFYTYSDAPQKCSGCEQLHSTTNTASRRGVCPFKDPVLRANHVGNVNCRRVGCLLETLLHEYCHVIEFAYRCVTDDKHAFGKHDVRDDENKLFIRIRGKITDHTSSFNNLLHAAVL